MKDLQANAAGHILRGAEAHQNRVAADHVFAMPTREVHDRKECNLNGNLARGSGLYTADGIIGRSGRKLFPGDIVTYVDLRRRGSTIFICRVWRCSTTKPTGQCG